MPTQILQRNFFGSRKSKKCTELFEVLRWNYWLNTESDEQFKFPNAFAAGYSRLIMKNESDLQGIFKLCKSTFDEE